MCLIDFIRVSLLAFLLSYMATIYAEPPYIDHRQLLLQQNRYELGDFNYGNFLTCLETASFEQEPGPRAVDTRIKRLVVTTIHNKKWYFETRDQINSVVIEDLTIGTQHIDNMNDKRKKILHILAHCHLEEEAPREQDSSPAEE